MTPKWGLLGSCDEEERHVGTLCGTPVFHGQEELTKDTKKEQGPGDRGVLETQWLKEGRSDVSDVAEPNSEGRGSVTGS